MEEKDVNNIASAVTAALAKLNTDTAAAISKEKENKEKENKDKDVIFKCPECLGDVAGGIKYCSHCGCELEWED